MKSKKRVRLCKLPTPGNIAGRSSTITNAFFNAIIPIDKPTEKDVLEALKILGMDPNDIRCAYCGDKSTEWDHLRPIIENQSPTGYITEIANLVPACGKCNQSKGNSEWKDWMKGEARLSPRGRDKTLAETEARIERLTAYGQWRSPTKIPIEEIVDSALWEKHKTNLNTVLELLKQSQSLAKEIKQAINLHRASPLDSQRYRVAAAKT